MPSSYTLTLSPQTLSLSLLQTDQQPFLPSSSSLIFVESKNLLIHHGYHKQKVDQVKNEGEVKTAEETKPKKKFVFKVGNKDKDGGGSAGGKNNAMESVQKVNVFSINENKWTHIQLRGKHPTPRHHHHTLMLHPTLLLMYGGRTIETDKPLNDLHALNIQTLQWKKLFSIQGPPAQDNNALVKLSESKVVLVGFRQVWTFQARDVKWELNANELPGGLWENLNLSFDPSPSTQHQTLLSGVNISLSPACQRLLIFTCHKPTHTLHSYLINLTSKEITKLKIASQQPITVDLENQRNCFGCYDYDQGEQVLLTMREKEGVRFLLVEYCEGDQCLRVVAGVDKQFKRDKGNEAMLGMGSCLDLENHFYFIDGPSITTDSTDKPQPKHHNIKKHLTTLTIDIQKNISAVLSSPPSTKQQDDYRQHDRHLKNQTSGYLNTSQIQSIPEESNESSVIGMKTHPNDEREDDEEFYEENGYGRNNGKDEGDYRYHVNKQHHQHHLGSGNNYWETNRSGDVNSEVNRSPSVLSREVESDQDEERTDRHYERMRGQHEHSIEQSHSSFYNNNSNANSPYSPQHPHPNASTKFPHPHQDPTQNNPSFFPQQQHLQQTLEKILVFEHIKRQKLQEKSKILQRSIQHSQTLAKLLTKYATFNEKNRHIEKVKTFKQELETIWNKEIFYRKQIHEHFVCSDSEMLEKNNGKGSESGINQKKSRDRSGANEKNNKSNPARRIDMKKLLRKHVAVEQ